MTITGKRDLSFFGERKSLSGLRFQSGRLVLEAQNITAVVTSNISVLSHRPERVAALIVNNSDTEKVIVYLGSAGSFWEVVLQPHGSMLLDTDFPWWGAVEVGASPTSAVVIVEELYLEG